MNKTRRYLLKAIGSGVIVIPAAGLVATTRTLAADMPKLNPDDPAAKALNYTQESADNARRCAGCQFYSGAKGDDWGPCVIFPEKLVSVNGVCNSWYPRAG